MPFITEQCRRFEAIRRDAASRFSDTCYSTYMCMYGGSVAVWQCALLSIASAYIQGSTFDGQRSQQQQLLWET